MSPRTRLVAAVCAGWTVLGVVSGTQSSLGAALQGRAEPLGAAIGSGLHQSLPWIPATLAVIALASRFPLTRANWRRRLGIHLAAVPLLAIGTNALVVLGYWVRRGHLGSLGDLAWQSVLWGFLRLHVAALLYGGGVAITQWLGDRQRLRERELALARLEASVERARLEVLTAQIRPHFLFNTLHAIGQMWRSGQADAADAMLDHLGSLFQKVIASTSKTTVTLDRELEMVRDYLAIEQGRFQERLVAQIDVEPAALACRVPPLLLQPLVENAVRHGVAASTSGGHVTVVAALLDEGRRLSLRVSDDGPGLGGGGGTGGAGVALANLRDRLYGAYGSHYVLETSESDGGGTSVRVELPAAWDDDGAGEERRTHAGAHRAREAVVD